MCIHTHTLTHMHTPDLQVPRTRTDTHTHTCVCVCARLHSDIHAYIKAHRPVHTRDRFKYFVL